MLMMEIELQPVSYKALLMFVHVVAIILTIILISVLTTIILTIILISVLTTIYPRITNEGVKAENSPDSSYS